MEYLILLRSCPSGMNEMVEFVSFKVENVDVAISTDGTTQTHIARMSTICMVRILSNLVCWNPTYLLGFPSQILIHVKNVDVAINTVNDVTT